MSTDDPLFGLGPVPIEVLRDTIQPFPSFSEIHDAALQAVRLRIAAAGSTAGAGSR